MVKVPKRFEVIKGKYELLSSRNNLVIPAFFA